MDSPEIFELTQIRKELAYAEELLASILWADSRGQGLLFIEAMDQAALFLHRKDTE